MNSKIYMIKGIVSEMSVEDQAEYEETLSKLHACVNKDNTPSLLALIVFTESMADTLDL